MYIKGNVSNVFYFSKCVCPGFHRYGFIVFSVNIWLKEEWNGLSTINGAMLQYVFILMVVFTIILSQYVHIWRKRINSMDLFRESMFYSSRFPDLRQQTTVAIYSHYLKCVFKIVRTVFGFFFCLLIYMTFLKNKRLEYYFK